MDNNVMTLLTEENFKKIVEWLTNDNCEMPEITSAFMTTLYYLYNDKFAASDETLIRRRRHVKHFNFPSIKKLEEEVREHLDKIKSDKNEQNAIPMTEPEDNHNTSFSDNASEEKTIPVQESSPSSITENTENAPAADVTKLNAARIGKAVRHCARLHNINISESHIQIILYVIYGNRLARQEEDIFGEIPKMWKYGPVFVSVYSSLKKESIPEEYECWKDVNKYSIQLGVDILNLVSGLGERKVKELSAKHTAHNTPWYDCMVMHPEKWGTELDVENIKNWFKKSLQPKSIIA